MIKFTMEMEDIHATITRQENGLYLLEAQDGDGNKGQKEIDESEAASLLFCSFDPSTDIDPFEVAGKAMEGFSVILIP